MQKIVIIKLGADGDVLRTIPLVEAIKNKYPDSNITWVTRQSISEMLIGLPFVNSVLTLPCALDESFDRLYNFDMETEATELAAKIDAKNKYGFYRDGNYPAAFNTGAEYYLNTVFDDALKKSNKRTYQGMMSELAEIPLSNKRYSLILGEHERKYAEQFFARANLEGKKVAGIHMGASARWPSKVWHPACLKEFIKIVREKGYEVLLFGGPNEAESQKNFVRELQGEKILVHHNNPTNTKREFAALVEKCDWVICSDSFALHVALGLGKKTIALFFCTSPHEVEGYGILRKIVSPYLHDYFPERSNEYSEHLAKSIPAEQVIEAMQ